MLELSEYRAIFHHIVWPLDMLQPLDRLKLLDTWLYRTLVTCDTHLCGPYLHTRLIGYPSHQDPRVIGTHDTVLPSVHEVYMSAARYNLILEVVDCIKYLSDLCDVILRLFSIPQSGRKSSAQAACQLLELDILHIHIAYLQRFSSNYAHGSILGTDEHITTKHYHHLPPLPALEILQEAMSN
jgi:hypothetical protein